MHIIIYYSSVFYYNYVTLFLVPSLSYCLAWNLPFSKYAWRNGFLEVCCGGLIHTESILSCIWEILLVLMYPKTVSAFPVTLFIHSFIYSFNKHLWSFCYMSGPKLGIRFLVSFSWHMIDYWHKLNLVSINDFDSVSLFIPFSLPGKYFLSHIFKLYSFSKVLFKSNLLPGQ